jgi:hypothetical protein
MPTDPFVAPTLDDAPRQETNLAPGVRMPAARGWRADRPGDLEAGQPTGTLLGRPGPNVGYAVTLAHRVSDRLSLGTHEPLDDVLSVVAEVAMKRAASYGRAPTTVDVDVATQLLGYQGTADPSFVEWRSEAIHGAHHEYEVRRGFVDAVPDGALRNPPQAQAELAELRAELRRFVEQG